MKKKNPLLSVNEKKVLKLESETVNGEVERISSYDFVVVIPKLYINRKIMMIIVI